MDPVTPLVVGGIIFLVVAILHLLRYLYKTVITIGSTVVPMWVSLWGFIIPLVLAFWMFYTAFSMS